MTAEGVGDAIGRAAASAERSARLREAAMAFEGMLVQMLVREMREAQLESGFFGSGPGASIYEGLFEQQLAERLSEGSPLGIARALLDRWNRTGNDDKAAEEALADLDRLRATRAYAQVPGSPADKEDESHGRSVSAVTQEPGK